MGGVLQSWTEKKPHIVEKKLKKLSSPRKKKKEVCMHGQEEGLAEQA